MLLLLLNSGSAGPGPVITGFYGTVAEADAYHLARGNSVWAQAAGSKEAALLRASFYVDSVGRRLLPTGMWQVMFSGTKAGGRDQLLEWPRKNAKDYEGNTIAADEVPIEVRNATYEAALREISNPGSLSPDYTPASLVKSQKAGPWEEEYFGPGASDSAVPNRPILSIVLDLLAPVLVPRWLGAAFMVV